jgi:hypothetical protein
MEWSQDSKGHNLLQCKVHKDPPNVAGRDGHTRANGSEEDSMPR